jgi:hypothetical protein
MKEIIYNEREAHNSDLEEKKHEFNREEYNIYLVRLLYSVHSILIVVKKAQFVVCFLISCLTLRL